MDTTLRGIGDNQPNAYEAARARVDALIEAANRWIAEVPEIADDDQAARCDDFKNQIVEAKTACENDRKAATKPLNDQVKEINGRYGELTQLLEIALGHVKRLKGGWLSKLQAKKDAEEQAARAEAARKAREAEEAAAAAAKQTTGDVVQAQAEAEKKKAEADAAAKAAEEIAAKSVTVKGDYSPKASGYRTSWKATLTNIDEAFTYYKDHPAVTELLTKIANADARSGRRRIPGFRIDEIKQVA